MSLFSRSSQYRYYYLFYVVQTFHQLIMFLFICFSSFLHTNQHTHLCTPSRERILFVHQGFSQQSKAEGRRIHVHEKQNLVEANVLVVRSGRSAQVSGARCHRGQRWLSAGVRQELGTQSRSVLKWRPARWEFDFERRCITYRVSIQVRGLFDRRTISLNTFNMHGFKICMQFFSFLFGFWYWRDYSLLVEHKLFFMFMIRSLWLLHCLLINEQDICFH